MITQNERLDFCKVCMNQKISYNKGITCRLTNEAADFEDRCDSFEEDSTLVTNYNKLKLKGKGEIASSGKRFANYLIDTIGYLILCFIIGIYIAFTSPELLDRISKEKSLTGYVFSFLCFYFYYFGLEALTGMTLGKLITGTKVVNEEGLKPGIMDLALRTICRFIPFEPLSLLGEDKLGWHDTLSKTKVVNR